MMWKERVESSLARVAFVTLQLVFFIFFLRFFIIEIGLVSGPSMEPNFHDGTLFAVVKPVFLWRAPRRFEVVQCIHPLHPQELIMKRVIGLPGETIAFKDNRVCLQKGVNDEQCFEEPYLPHQFLLNRVGPGQASIIHIPQDEYYVLGDNRRMSTDSRSFGPLKRTLILGKVFSL